MENLCYVMERQEIGLELLRDTRELFGLQDSTKIPLLQSLVLLTILRMLFSSMFYSSLYSFLHNTLVIFLLTPLVRSSLAFNLLSLL